MCFPRLGVGEPQSKGRRLKTQRGVLKLGGGGVPCVTPTHLLELQLDDLLFEGISLVLSLHVGLFETVLLGTETPEHMVSWIPNLHGRFGALLATKPQLTHRECTRGTGWHLAMPYSSG